MSSTEPRYRYGKRLHESHAKAQKARQLRRDETPPEGILWSKLRNRRLDDRKFRRQHPIGAYVLDFYCEKLNLAVEIDGAMHDRRRVADVRRDAWLGEHGVTVVRFSARDVTTNLEGVIKEIRKFAARIEKE